MEKSGSSNLQLYSTASRIIHGQTVCEPVGRSLRVTTPVDQWAYAVEFPPHETAPVIEKNTKLRLRARVYEGAIGLGLLTPRGTEYQREVQVAENEESEVVEIPLPEGNHFGALILRNTSVRGKSRADLDILECEVSSDSQVKNAKEIVVDPAIFGPFKSWSGRVPSGFWADWTGNLTRVDVWSFSAEDLARGSQDRYEALHTSDVLDWTLVAQAVRDSSTTFRMAALGAGFGRWCAAGAALAAQIGREYRLLGVEAEPQHFQWMLRHFKENNIPESHYIALEAAAVGRPGDCWFPVGNSQAWYGQAVCSEDQILPRDVKLRRTRGVTIDEILKLLSPLDYLQMDIQGAEFDVLSYRPDCLDRQVRLVNIGTHSAEIEALLRKLFKGLAWECLHDVRLGSRIPVRLGNELGPEVEFGDGVQVWRNPRLRVK
jgi:FkbM family methyltransferase